MAKRKKAKAAKPLTAAQKRKFLKHMLAAQQGVKALTASVKTMRAAAAAASFITAMPVAARRRRRKRG